MISTTTKIVAVGIFLLAALYQGYVKDTLLVRLGIGRHLQPIEDFPYNCRQLRHHRLEACEDLWLDEQERTLYAACGSSASRMNWLPATSCLNASGRALDGDYVSVLHIDEPGDDGLFGLSQLKPIGGDFAKKEILGLHGFDVDVMSDSKLKLWLINHRAPVDVDGKLLDATKLGANSTVEEFEVIRGSNEMRHIKTIANEMIATPNKLAATGDGGFLVVNDHSSKVGWRRELDPLLGGGNIAYCRFSKCHIAATGLNTPNGIVKGKNGLYYIPSTLTDQIWVMKLREDLMLEVVDMIYLGMPVDNLSVDKNGDIYAAALPKILDILKSFKKPYEISCPSTIWRIRKSGSSHQVQKVLEDKEGKLVSGATTACHDASTGRFFIGGVITPYITVCDPR
ncbi:hypothetical protein MMC07_008592 [Pseudocyphellaria aurata]|nr:hypothetical protein [Pseudocyphellaria aurata]